MDASQHKNLAGFICQRNRLDYFPTLNPFGEEKTIRTKDRWLVSTHPGRKGVVKIQFNDERWFNTYGYYSSDFKCPELFNNSTTARVLGVTELDNVALSVGIDRENNWDEPKVLLKSLAHIVAQQNDSSKSWKLWLGDNNIMTGFAALFDLENMALNDFQPSSWTFDSFDGYASVFQKVIYLCLNVTDIDIDSCGNFGFSSKI